MDPLSLGLIGGGLASLAGGIFGASKKSAADEQAAKSQAEALKQWLALNIPNIDEQRIFLQQLKSEGQLSPELEQAITAPDSLMSSVSTDPALKAAQLEALSGLKNISDSGGQTLEDKANLNAAMNEIGAIERGKRDAIMQNMQARGVAGSGLELAAKLSNQQAAATSANQVGLQVAADAQRRALEALMQRGSLAGDVRSQEFGEQSDKAKAQDIINQYNARNRQDVQQRNVDAKNAASLYNLQERQRIADTNVGLQNQQEMHNKALIQKQFDNQTTKAGGTAGQYGQQAAQQTQQGNDAAAMWSQLGSGVGQSALRLADHETKRKQLIGQ